MPIFRFLAWLYILVSEIFLLLNNSSKISSINKLVLFIFLLLFSYSFTLLEASIDSAKFIRFIKCVNALVNLKVFFEFKFFMVRIIFL